MSSHERLPLRALAVAVLATICIPALADVGECGADPAAGTHGALFTLDGVAYQESDLPTSFQQLLYDVRLEHYERQRKVFDAALMDIEIARVAAETGGSKEAVARDLLTVPPVSDAAITAFYQANQAKIPYPLPAVRDQIRQMIAEQSLEQQRAAVIAGVKQERAFEVSLARPLAPYAEIAIEGLPSKGAVDAPVTIVEFADYQCPHCANAASALGEIAERYGDRVRVVFMDFPVNRSGISRTVAEGAACADQQGRFWSYHDLAFSTQDRLGPESALQLAKALELDVDAFRACLDSSFPKERVARSEGEARRLGLSATPTIFVNGRRQSLRDVAAEIPAVIDAALAARGS